MFLLTSDIWGDQPVTCSREQTNNIGCGCTKAAKACLYDSAGHVHRALWQAMWIVHTMTQAPLRMHIPVMNTFHSRSEAVVPTPTCTTGKSPTCYLYLEVLLTSRLVLLLLLLRWLSAMGYAFSQSLKVEFTGATFSCAQGVGSETVTLMQQLMPNSPMLRSSAFIRTVEQPGENCILDPQALVEYFGATEVKDWMNPVCLLVYLVVLHVVTYLGLVLLARKERR